MLQRHSDELFAFHGQNFFPAVVAGNGMGHGMSAFFTDADVIAKFPGLAFGDAFGGFALFGRNVRMSREEGRIETPECITDLVFVGIS